ncbi:unnamed protein product [Rhizophagus irregularis]|nr:unnamed protein product [Rhizophagus irregularis]
MFRKSYRGEIFDTEKGISKEQFNKSYKGEIFGIDDHDEIEKQFKKAEEYRKDNLLSNKNSRSHTTHPKAVYTSRLLNSFTKNLPKYEDTECLDLTNLFLFIKHFTLKNFLFTLLLFLFGKYVDEESGYKSSNNGMLIIRLFVGLVCLVFISI